MRRYLVVANQTLGGQHLLDEVGARAAVDECSFHVLVPATFTHDHAFHTAGAGIAAAQRRLDAALARFRDLGLTVDGHVGDVNPLYAIEDALRADDYDEVILSTLPAGPSRWLRQDLPHRLARQTEVPVTHIVGTPELAPAS